MPRYYFDFHNTIGPVPDEEGHDLPGPEAARAEALKGARAIIADEALNGRVDLRGRIDVRGEGNEVLFTIAFAEAVEIRGPPALGATQE